MVTLTAGPESGYLNQKVKEVPYYFAISWLIGLTKRKTRIDLQPRSAHIRLRFAPERSRMRRNDVSVSSGLGV